MSDVKEKIQYCPDCGRSIGIACTCGLSFIEKMKSVSLILPANFRAVR